MKINIVFPAHVESSFLILERKYSTEYSYILELMAFVSFPYCKWLVSRIVGPSIEHLALVYRLVLLSETHVRPEMHPMRKWRIVRTFVRKRN